jgi:hypothetical protein
MWGLEASEVFQMDLPDAVTGACPVGGIPVYRIWNQRVDSNHRYTTSIAIRDQMVGKGGSPKDTDPTPLRYARCLDGIYSDADKDPRILARRRPAVACYP